MRVITNVKAAVRRARARGVDNARGMTSAELRDEIRAVKAQISGAAGIVLKRERPARYAELEKRLDELLDASSYRAKDTLTPIPVSGDREKDLAIAKHNAGVTRSQDRRVRDAQLSEDSLFTLGQYIKTGSGKTSSSGLQIRRAIKEVEKAHGAEQAEAAKRYLERFNANGATDAAYPSQEAWHAFNEACKTPNGKKVYTGARADKALKMIESRFGKEQAELCARSAGRATDTSTVRHAQDRHAQDRRAKDGSKFEWECPKCNQVFTGDNRDALEDRAYAHLEHSHKAETTVRIKQVATDTFPVFNLSPVPMPEEEHGKGRYARAWGEDALTPIPMEDAEVTTRRQPNPNPNPRSITSLALPTPVDVSNAYRPRSATELSKSFGKDEFGAGQKIKYQDPRSGKWLPGTVTGPARKVNGFNGVLPVKNDAGQNVDVHYDRVKAADAGYASPEDMAELKAKLAKAEAAIAKVKAAGKNILHYPNLIYERDKLKRMVANYRTNDALTPIGRAKDAAGGTYTMKEVNGKWVVYSADGKKICTYDDKAAAQHCVRLSMPNRIKSAKDAGPLTQKCVNCGMPIYKDTKYDVGKWLHGGTSQAGCSGGPGSSQFPELWPKKATPKATAKDALRGLTPIGDAADGAWKQTGKSSLGDEWTYASNVTGFSGSHFEGRVEEARKSGYFVASLGFSSERRKFSSLDEAKAYVKRSVDAQADERFKARDALRPMGVPRKADFAKEVAEMNAMNARLRAGLAPSHIATEKSAVQPLVLPSMVPVSKKRFNGARDALRGLTPVGV
jgi:hypothetical protein